MKRVGNDDNEAENSPENLENPTIWDEEKLAALLKFDKRWLEKDDEEESEDVENVLSEDEAYDNSELPNNSANDSSLDDDDELESHKGQAISQKELFDDEAPHNNKTQPTFSGNPFAKSGVVGLGLLIIFGTAALFLNGIMGPKISRAPTRGEPAQKSSRLPLEKPPQNEVGELKTQLALKGQEEQMKALGEERNDRGPNTLKSPEDSDKRKNATVAIAPRPVHAATPPRAPTPVPMRTPTPIAPPPPRITPSTKPKPVQEPEVERRIVETPAPQPIPPPPVPTPVPMVELPPKEPPKEPPNPNEQWLALSQLGAYGETASDEESVAERTFEEDVDGDRHENNVSSPIAAIPRAVMVPPPLATDFDPSLGGTVTSRSILSEESAILNERSQRPIEQSPIEQTSPVAFLPGVSGTPAILQEEEALLIQDSRHQENPEGLPDEEVILQSAMIQDSQQQLNTIDSQENPDVLPSEEAILQSTITPNYETTSSQHVRRLVMGQQIDATLITPIIGFAESSRSQTTVSGRAQTTVSEELPERFVVQLNFPLTNRDGTVLVPAQSQVIFEVQSIAENGVVNADAIAIVDGAAEYRLPAGVLSIRGENGRQLSAKEVRTGGREIFSRDTRAFALGALAKVGQVLNQPESEESSESDSDGYSRRNSRTTRGNPSIFGAVLEGGFSPLIQQVLERNQRAIDRIEARPPLWTIKEGQKVMVFVNATFEL